MPAKIARPLAAFPAVAAARKALPKWSASSGYQRAKALYAIGRAMQRHQRLFAVVESIDNGKPIRESRDIDVPLAIRHFLHHAGWAQALDREFLAAMAAGDVERITRWTTGEFAAAGAGTIELLAWVALAGAPRSPIAYCTESTPIAT